MGARALVIPVALAGAVLFTLAPSSAAPAAAAEPKTEAQQIIEIARKQIGDPWRYGASGPRSFDCSGLVIYSYRKAGDGKVIRNGKLRSARALYHYFRAKGLADRKNPKPGDLVIWGGGTHVGIYIGKGKAVSTLTSGVRVHKVHAVTARFTAYLHTGMWKRLTDGSTLGTVAATATEKAAAAIEEIRRTDGHVNLRTGPGVAYRRLGTLRDGARLEVVKLAKDADGRPWIKVRVGARTGWVAEWLTD